MRWRLGWRVRPRLTAAAGLAAVRAPCSTRRPCGPLWGAAHLGWRVPLSRGSRGPSAGFLPPSAARLVGAHVQQQRDHAGVRLRAPGQRQLGAAQQQQRGHHRAHAAQQQRPAAHRVHLGHRDACRARLQGYRVIGLLGTLYPARLSSTWPLSTSQTHREQACCAPLPAGFHTGKKTSDYDKAPVARQAGACRRRHRL